jgi:hypothetical protein
MQFIADEVEMKLSLAKIAKYKKEYKQDVYISVSGVYYHSGGQQEDIKGLYVDLEGVENAILELDEEVVSVRSHHITMDTVLVRSARKEGDEIILDVVWGIESEVEGTFTVFSGCPWAIKDACRFLDIRSYNNVWGATIPRAFKGYFSPTLIAAYGDDVANDDDHELSVKGVIGKLVVCDCVMNAIAPELAVLDLAHRTRFKERQIDITEEEYRKAWDMTVEVLETGDHQDRFEAFLEWINSDATMRIEDVLNIANIAKKCAMIPILCWLDLNC